MKDPVVIYGVEFAMFSLGVLIIASAVYILIQAVKEWRNR